MLLDCSFIKKLYFLSSALRISADLSNGGLNSERPMEDTARRSNLRGSEKPSVDVRQSSSTLPVGTIVQG